MPAGTLNLTGLFNDGMVFQRDLPVPVWGRAQPAEEVQVRIAGQEKQVLADAEGRWMVRLDPLQASRDPRELVIQAGKVTRTIREVLVGEVWLCSGQSNMEWPVQSSLDADLILLTADRPMIRLYDVEKVFTDKPREMDGATWQRCSPETVATFSAVGYEFGRILREALDVPIGLIDASWGGTPAIAWTRAEVFPRHPVLLRKQQGWVEEPNEEQPHFAPAGLANGMIAPVAPYAMRGVLWYQGESDAWSEQDSYKDRLALMIADWRAWWGLPELPFGIVQLANWGAPVEAPWARLRDSQLRLAQSDPRIGLAVTFDIGEANDMHPRDKTRVGQRLARWALAEVYKKIELAGGPVLREMRIQDAEIHLVFDRIGDDLLPYQGEPLKGFTVAGTDRVFHPATARIEHPDTVILSSSEVTHPVAARYGWQNNPREANLCNSARLPASPFRTDDWPMPPQSEE